MADPQIAHAMPLPSMYLYVPQQYDNLPGTCGRYKKSRSNVMFCRHEHLTTAASHEPYNENEMQEPSPRQRGSLRSPLPLCYMYATRQIVIVSTCLACANIPKKIQNPKSKIPNSLLDPLFPFYARIDHIGNPSPKKEALSHTEYCFCGGCACDTDWPLNCCGVVASCAVFSPPLRQGCLELGSLQAKWRPGG